MSKGLIKITGALPSPLPTNWVRTSIPNLYLSAPMPETLPEGATVLGEWDDEGNLLGSTLAPGGVGALLMVEGIVVDPDTGEESVGLVPMPLAFHHFMGDGERQWVSEQFPPSNFSPEFSEDFG